MSTRLNGKQGKLLRDAILSAYSSADLEQLVQFDLNERLEGIVGPGSLSEVVFKLIQWAEAHGQTTQLLRALRDNRPNNAEIQAVAKELLPRDAVPVGDAPLDGPRRSRLRAALLDQFPNRTELAMLVDDTLSVNLNKVASGSNLTETVFELIQWASIDPQGQMRPLLTEAVARRPNSAELKALKRELFGDGDRAAVSAGG